MLNVGKAPIMIGKKPVKMQLTNGEIIKFYVLIELDGTEWVPLEVMARILKVNRVPLTVMRKEEGMEDESFGE